MLLLSIVFYVELFLSFFHMYYNCSYADVQSSFGIKCFWYINTHMGEHEETYLELF